MERNYVLYLHTTPSGKRYYGITGMKPNERWRNGKGYPNNPYFTKAINKYGWNNIKHEIICEGLTKYEAQELEQYMIQWYNTANKDYGYNISLGGEGGNGCKHTKEWKQKISENNARYWKGKHHAEETKKKISETKKGKQCGKNNPKAKSVICLTTKKIFFAANEAGRYYNTQQSSITQCCQGKRKSAGKLPDGTKLVWRYLNYKHNKTYRLKK